MYIAGNTFKSTPTRGILVTTPKPVLIERNHFDQMGMASIYISADADYWYESSGVTNATIRNNIFDRPAAGWAAIWFDPTNAESEPERSVHSNISIDANRFMLAPGGTLVAGKSVAGLSFTNNVVGHYAPTAAAPLDAAGGTVQLRREPRPGFRRQPVRARIQCGCRDLRMPAGEVDGASDGVAARVVDAAGGAPARDGRRSDGRHRTLHFHGRQEPCWRRWPNRCGPASSSAQSLPAGLAHACTAGPRRWPLRWRLPSRARPCTSTTTTGPWRRPRRAHVLGLLSGPDILEVRTLSACRSAGQTYRWVVIAG